MCVYIYTGSQDAQTHVASVWEQVVSNRKALRSGDLRQSVLIAAHSTGGPAVLALMRARPLEFVTHVLAVALLDSVHKNLKLVTNSSDVCVCGGVNHQLTAFCRERVCNFVTSSMPVGHEWPKAWHVRGAGGITNRSAGHTHHLHVPAAAENGVFSFFKALLEQLELAQGQGQCDGKKTSRIESSYAPQVLSLLVYLLY